MSLTAPAVLQMSLRATERSVAIDPKGRCEGEARGKPTKSLRAPKGRGNLYNRMRFLRFRSE